MQAKKVRVAEIERIRGTMKNAPEHPVDEVTTAEAVRMLSPEIHAMQEKGYGLPAIAAHLSDNGLAMTTKTLKTYLTEARATGGRKKRRAAKRVGSATGAGSTAPTTESKPAGVAQAGPAAARVVPKATPPVTTQATAPVTLAAAKGTTGTTRPGDDPGVRRSAFVPKEDTRDI
ncbi:MAG: hypothetical protein ACLP1X_19920 [Polyangiaceae bacterium]|jgi:hypothetical protein